MDIEKAERQKDRIIIDVRVEGSIHHRNRLAIQRYFWLEKTVGRENWDLLKDQNDRCRIRYFIDPRFRSAAVLFKLTWGGR